MTGVLVRKRDETGRDTWGRCTWKEDMQGHRGKAVICKPRRGASEKLILLMP